MDRRGRGLLILVAALVWVTALCTPFTLASPALARAGVTTTAVAALPSPATVNSRLKLQRLRSTSAGGEIVQLRCAAGSGGCHVIGTLSIVALGRSAIQVQLGTETTTIPAGSTQTLTIKLNRSAKALLARRGKLAEKLEITLTVGRTRILVATRLLIAKAPNPLIAATGTQVVDYAKQFIAVPYVYGGNGPTTFDCSGFTSYVYAHFGYHLERTAYSQMHQGRAVTGPLEIGDLIFWDGGGHVGIYTGNQTFISATVHRGIWIYSLQVWSQTQSYTTARRILGAPTAGSPAIAASWLPRNGGPADATP